MKTLILSMYFYPDLGANSVIITELAQELDKLGHEVTVVTAFPHYKNNVVEVDYRGKLIALEQYGNIRILRTYLYTSPNKKDFLVRFLNYVSFNFLSTLAGIFSGPQDIILAPSPPLTIGLSAMIIGWLKRIPYIYNVQDINPDVLIKLGIIKNPLFIRFSKALEKFVYNKAAKITVLSQGFVNNLYSKGVPESKLEIIPNFIDPGFVVPGSKVNDFSIKFGIADRFVVLYAGNIGHSQNIDLVIESADLLQEEKEIVFVIVGNGSREDEFKQMASSLNLENVIFIPFQPKESIPDIYASANICLVPLRKEIAFDSVPSKMLTIMASSRPILAAVDRDSDAWKLVLESDSGVCVEPGNPQRIVDAIIALQNDPNRCTRYGEKGRQYVLRFHTREKIGNQYHQLITAMIGD